MGMHVFSSLKQKGVRLRGAVAVGIGALELLLPTTADAALNQFARESGRILAPAPQNRDGFGVAVASNATHLVIGAPGFSNSQSLEAFGAVHVFERRSGESPVLVQSISGPQDSADRRFGVSLAMGADFFAVGSTNHFNKTGNPRAVLDIHGMNQPSPGGWGRVARVELDSTFLLSADQIVSVASDGQAVFAGFHAMEKVLVVERGSSITDWQVTRTVQAPDKELFDNFGGAVAIHGDWLAVAAPFEDEAGSDKGAIYLFSRNGGSWTFAQKLLPPVSSSGSRLGQCLSLDGEWLAAGDTAGDINLYRRDSDGVWSFVQTLSNFAADYQAFHLKGAELLCGSVSYSAGSTSSGRGELFGYNSAAGTWQRQAEFRSSQPQSYGLIGSGARIDDQGYFLGSGHRATSISGTTIPPGTCHIYPRPALDSYATWAQRVFPPDQLGTALSDPEAVANPLGVTNWLSYAMGVDPLSPDPTALPRVEFDALEQRWGLRFQIRPNAADFSWRSVFSADLQTWTTYNGSFNAISYGPEVQRHFRKLPAGAVGPRFFRVEVTPLAE